MSEWRDGSYVGKHLTTTDYDVTPELVADYIERTGDANPWYLSDSPFGGPVAPATLLYAHAHEWIGDWYLPSRYGNLHTKQEWALFQPVMVGDHIRATRTITDRFRKRDREIVINDVTVVNQAGVLVAKSRTHQSFVAPEITSGTIVDRGREKRGERRIEPGAGETIERFGDVTRLIDQDFCNRFTGEFPRNYHNDREQAEQLGFPGVVVQGTLSICFLNEIMSRRFGLGWWIGGRMTLNLVNVVWMDDALEAHGVIRDWTPEGERRRAGCEIWAAKPDGTVATIGAASALAD